MVLPFAFASQYSCPPATTETVLSLRLVTTERELRRNYSAQVTEVCNSSFSGFIQASLATFHHSLAAYEALRFGSSTRWDSSTSTSTRSRVWALPNWKRQLVPYGIDWVSFRITARCTGGMARPAFLTRSPANRENRALSNGKRQSVSHVTVCVDFQSVSGSTSRTFLDARYLSRQRPQSPSFKPVVLYHSRLLARIRHWELKCDSRFVTAYLTRDLNDAHSQLRIDKGRWKLGVWESSTTDTITINQILEGVS